MRRLVFLMLMGVLCTEWLLVPQAGEAQLAVIDSAAVFQLAASVRQELELVAQGERDLRPWIEGSQVAQDLQKLIALGTKVAGIVAVLRARRIGWLELTSAAQRPTTLAALDTWTFQARTWAIAGAEEASTALDVLDDAVELVNTALSLLDRIPGISGSVAGLQTVTAALSTMNGLFAGMQGMIAPFHQALLGQQMIKDVAAQVWREFISPSHLSDWGTME
jgi:hypothetical protein